MKNAVFFYGYILLWTFVLSMNVIFNVQAEKGEEQCIVQD